MRHKELEYVGADNDTPPPPASPSASPPPKKKKKVPSKKKNVPSTKKIKVQEPTGSILVVTDPPVIDLTNLTTPLSTELDPFLRPFPKQFRIKSLDGDSGSEDMSICSYESTDLTQARLNIHDLQKRVEYLEQMLQMVLMQQEQLKSTVQSHSMYNYVRQPLYQPPYQPPYQPQSQPSTSGTNKQYQPLPSQDAASAKPMPLRPSKSVNNALPSSVIKKDNLVPVTCHCYSGGKSPNAGREQGNKLGPKTCETLILWRRSYAPMYPEWC